MISGMQLRLLRSLRRLEFSAVTHFTADGMLDFIGKLGIGNKGLVLDVMNSKRQALVGGARENHRKGQRV